jgi:hypothetical protein
MRTFGTLLAIAMMAGSLQACSSSGNGGGASASKFIGTWHPTSGTVTTTCPGLGTDTSAVVDNIIWAMGVSSDLVQTDPSTSCVLTAHITGSTAAGTGAPCTVSDGAGGTATITITSYTFVLGADGQTGTENGSGTVVDNNGGVSITCTLSETAAYQKVSN